MQPTKEQWDDIASRLDSLFDTVYLRCDGYLVTAGLKRAAKNRLKIEVSVNGWVLKGEWLPSFSSNQPREMSEEARRFWMPRSRQRMTKKELKSWERIIGKRECRKRGYYDPYIWPEPVWNRPLSLIRHLKKHNECIEVLDYETYKAERDALQEKEGE